MTNVTCRWSRKWKKKNYFCRLISHMTNLECWNFSRQYKGIFSHFSRTFARNTQKNSDLTQKKKLECPINAKSRRKFFSSRRNKKNQLNFKIRVVVFFPYNSHLLITSDESLTEQLEILMWRYLKIILKTEKE